MANSSIRKQLYRLAADLDASTGVSYLNFKEEDLLAFIAKQVRAAEIEVLSEVVKLPGHFSARDYDAYCNKRISKLQPLHKAEQ